MVKPSNVLKLARAVLPQATTDEREQIVYYDVGVGALSRHPGTANWLLFLADKILGGYAGAGFENNMCRRRRTPGCRSVSDELTLFAQGWI